MIFPGYPDGDQPPLMRPEGTGALRVMAFGEALGDHEAKDQLPFRPYAEAGSLLERALRISGIDRTQLTLTNLVWYQPPNNWLDGAPWETDAIAVCRPWNEKLIEERQPRCLLAFGGLPFRELSGMSGYRQGILLTRGFPVESMYGMPVVGTYHPSYLRRGAKEESKETGVRVEGAAGRGMDLLGVLIRDIQLAVSIARNGWKFETAEDVHYREHATLDDMRSLIYEARLYPELPISWDIETGDTLKTDDESETVVEEHSNIYQIQFSLREKEAVIFNWQEGLAPLIVELLGLQNPKLDFNGRKTDRPITKRFLTDKGYVLELPGDTHDLMDMWHHAQPDLPKGLQFVSSFYAPEIGPWKHLDTSNPHFYGGRDVDAPQRIWQRLPGDLRKIGIWPGYERHILKLSRVLDRMSERGIPINDQARMELGVLLDKDKAQMERDIQARIPEEIRPIHPKHGGYKKLTGKVKEKLYRGSGQTGLMAMETLPDRIDVDGETYVRREFPEIDQNTCGEKIVLRWAQLMPFNPNSSDQVIAYIKHKREQEIAAYMGRGHSREKAEQRAKYKVPKHAKDRSKDTTEKRGLLQLGKTTGDPLFSECVQIREFGKLKGTYVDGWRPDNSRRVHPAFGFAPATGQLSSDGPNAQNIPSEKSRGAAGSPTIARLAAQFRRLIEADDDHYLIEFDWRAFHALTLGFCAKDASYMRLARLDIHSFFAACGLLKIASADKLLAMPDAELMEYLKWVKKTHPVVRDGQAKPAVLGYGLGMRGYTLWEQNPESFANRNEADAVLDKLDRTFPITAAWRKQIQLDAHERKCLILKPWYIRRFWDVFENKPVKDNYQPRRGERLFRDGRGQFWKVGHGTDAEAAIAMFVQNAAHGHMKENMLEIHERGWAERFGLINTVHDALWFHCHSSLVDECVANVLPQMELPSTVLRNEVASDGLWCGVEATIGKNMTDREKVEVGRRMIA